MAVIAVSVGMFFFIKLLFQQQIDTMSRQIGELEFRYDAARDAEEDAVGMIAALKQTYDVQIKQFEDRLSKAEAAPQKYLME